MFYFFLFMMLLFCLHLSDNFLVFLFVNFIFFGCLLGYTSYHRDYVLDEVRKSYCQQEFPGQGSPVTKFGCISSSGIKSFPFYLQEE